MSVSIFKVRGEVAFSFGNYQNFNTMTSTVKRTICSYSKRCCSLKIPIRLTHEQKTRAETIKSDL